MRRFEAWRRRLLRAAVSGVAGLLLAACGGGGGGGGGLLPWGGGGDPGRDPSSGFSAEQRTAATDRIVAKLEQLTGGGEAEPAHWDALRDWVLTQPEFVEAGVEDKAMWARFSDGRYFVYSDNWRAPPASEVSEAPARKQKSALAAAAEPEVPGSADALLLGFRDPDFALGNPAMARMVQAVTDRGWKVASDHGLTVDALKGRGELGFLYLTSHSAVFGPTGNKHFSVMTETEISNANDQAYAADLRDNSLIYHRDRDPTKREPRYAVTAGFVDKYLRFSPNSLVVMLSCNSGSAAAARFRDALFRQKAGTVVGWEGNSNYQAFDTVDMLVDRLTGANAVNAVLPANRPFNMGDVWNYLGRKGLLVTPPLHPEKGDKEAYVRRFGEGFQMLVPIITELRATGPDKLILQGDFGTEPGTVTVGGRLLAPVWAPDGKTVEVDLGPDAHGEVFVMARGRRSNSRVLASWRGQVTYEHLEPWPECNARFRNTAVIDLHLRADAHALRKEVDGPLENNPHLVVPASGTRASWIADGICRDASGVHTQWSGSGSFTFSQYIDELSPYPPTGDMIHLLQARIDAVEGRFQLAGVFGHDALFTESSPGATSKRPINFDPELAGFVNPGPDYTKLFPFGTFLPFNLDRNVPANKHIGVHSSGTYSERVEWGTLSVSPAYDDSVPR